MKVYCPKCGHTQDYKGASKDYYCCSFCKKSVRIFEVIDSPQKSPIKKRVVAKATSLKNKMKTKCTKCGKIILLSKSISGICYQCRKKDLK